MKLKRILSMVLVFVMSFSLIACSSPAPSNEAATEAPAEEATEEVAESSEPVTIHYWTQQTQNERLENIRALLDVFEILNPDVKVEMIGVDENDFSSQFAAAGDTQNRPVLIEATQILSMSLSQEGVIDSDANKAVIDTIGADEYLDGSLDLVKLDDGTYYGVPFHFFLQGVWYRTDWFEQAGLEAPDSWENILAAAEYFYKPEDKQYGILIGTQPDNFTQQVFTQFATTNDAHLYDAEGNLTIDSPEFIEAVEMYKKLAEYNPPGPQNWRAGDYYIQGKLPMFFYSTYIMDDLSTAEAAASSLTSENFSELEGGEFDAELVNNTGFIPVISNKSDSSYGELSTLSILKNDDARKTEAAERLAEFFYQQENYVPYLHIAVGLLPAMKSTIQSDDFLNDPKGAYAKYGGERILEIASGVGSIRDFLSIEGKPLPESSTILAKNILAQSLYNVIIEDKDVNEEMSAARVEIESAVK